jgi:hypothetical protein
MNRVASSAAAFSWAIGRTEDQVTKVAQVVSQGGFRQRGLFKWHGGDVLVPFGRESHTVLLNDSRCLVTTLVVIEALLDRQSRHPDIERRPPFRPRVIEPDDVHPVMVSCLVWLCSAYASLPHDRLHCHWERAMNQPHQIGYPSPRE